MTRSMKAVVTLLLAGVMLVTVSGHVSAAVNIGVMACWNNGCPTDQENK